MVIARLFSGLNTLLESGHWEHAGSPAYYHFIRGLDAETSWDYTLCFLLPHPYTGFECKRSLNITNLRSSALIVPYYSLPFSSSFTLIKKAEYFYNKLSQYIAVLPSLIGSNCFYIDRENLLLGAFLLPFKKKIAVRLLGVTESVYLNVTQKRNIYSSLLRYVFTHRNSLFICTRDGSFSDQMGAWLSWKRFYIFFNGIDIERIERNKRREDRPFTIVSVSRLEKNKGQSQLLQAAKHSGVKNIRIILIGEGVERRKLESLAKELELEDRTIFTGKLIHNNAIKYLEEADLVVSLNCNGVFGNNVLEAAQVGLPVIALEHPGCQDENQKYLSVLQ